MKLLKATMLVATLLTMSMGAVQAKSLTEMKADAQARLLIALADAKALGADMLTKERQIATGSEGGGYNDVGDRFAVHLRNASSKQIDMTSKFTKGSAENIKLFNEKTVDAMIIQADSPDPIERRASAYSLYDETVMWVYNPDIGVKDLEDMEGRDDVRFVIVEGSGSHGTFSSFVKEDKGYAINMEKALWVTGSYEAFQAVAKGEYDGFKVAGTIYVGSRIPDKLAKDFGDDVMIGAATDGDFNDAEDMNGDDLYTNCEVTDENANGIETAGWSDPDTVCVKSMLVIADDVKSSEKDWFVEAAVKTTRDEKSRH